MKLSEYIGELEKILREHGDLAVETEDYDLRRVAAPPPTIDYRLILKGRESKARFLRGSFNDNVLDRRGEKVCRV